MSGDTFASVVQAALTTGTGGSADIMVKIRILVVQLLPLIFRISPFTYDADTAELVFRDSAGRAMGFGYDGSANGLHGLGIGPLLDDNTTGNLTNRLQLREILLEFLKVMLLMPQRLL